MNKLAIGGPMNGERMGFRKGVILEFPEGVIYNLKTLRLGEEEVQVYVYKGLSDEEALRLLQQGYLEI